MISSLQGTSKPELFGSSYPSMPNYVHPVHPRRSDQAEVYGLHRENGYYRHAVYLLCRSSARDAVLWILWQLFWQV